MIVWCYDVDEKGNTFRAPIDLDTLAIDLLRAEPWHEPPSRVGAGPRYCRRCKRSGRCKHTRMKENNETTRSRNISA